MQIHHHQVLAAALAAAIGTLAPAAARTTEADYIGLFEENVQRLAQALKSEQ